MNRILTRARAAWVACALVAFAAAAEAQQTPAPTPSASAAPAASPTAAPGLAPRRRLDETRAARQPKLRWSRPSPA